VCTYAGSVAELRPEIEEYYRRGRERARLATGGGLLELLRTQDVLRRTLPARGRILDVGGGPGRYARWLGELGYDVELIDAMPLHVEQAREAGVRARLGDARALPWGDGEWDAALLLGPLYHLPERDDRIRSLSECRRVVRPGGVDRMGDGGREMKKWMGDGGGREMKKWMGDGGRGMKKWTW
jgi:SAM-dependent methyltransferase